ncbi:beta-glycosidase [Fibrella aestuarina BUZ 2]|uniref:Beta-glycosidase n=1 Tax=Fibrella aestuarina BUZ 2 TaxID=1166018 RepID=I0KEV8_9BACT|nr:glycoside hydrolase [Fibrella aestuarina]CCH02661.1 beta-glycosidase [Fibrella aestuarina BUZ 2]
MTQRYTSRLLSLGCLLILSRFGLAQPAASAQLVVRLDPSQTYQTMHSFGASDCWSAQFVGKNYPLAKREQVADWLFSLDVDRAGNPKGIGLSMWRFNIGAGSTEQGDSSGIRSPWRRSECFQRPDGSYDWTKQAGQQWFMEAAHRRKVPYLLGFTNSPPVQFTANGKAYASGTLGDYNFNRQRLGDYARFLADVAQHFDKKGLSMQYLSPFNEPQWDWGIKKGQKMATQEGTPATNADMAELTRALSRELSTRNLRTRLTLGEAGQLNYLSQSGTNRSQTGQDNVAEAFFSPGSPAYIGDLPNVEKLVCGHSYFTTSPPSQLRSVRQQLGAKLKQVGVGFWQSEYCVLGDNAGEIDGGGRDLGMTTALYVARVIHADLTLANATSWQWWLSISANNYKDGLVYLENGGKMGENGPNQLDGDVLASKTLWALGNYARFVRPGMVRIAASTNVPDSLANGPLVSAYRSENGKQFVVVIANPGDARALRLEGLSRQPGQVAVYETTDTADLRKRTPSLGTLMLAARSVTTITLTR